MPLLLVGERTREAALERGFEGPMLIAPDAKTLATQVCTRFAVPSHFVYLAGRDRKPDLEECLTEAGFEIEPIEVYAPQPAESLSDACLGLCRKQAASGGVALFPAERGEFPRPRADSRSRPFADKSYMHLAEAAAPLLDARLNGVLIAEAPNEQAMFEIVNTLTDPP